MGALFFGANFGYLRTQSELCVPTSAACTTRSFWREEAKPRGGNGRWAFRNFIIRRRRSDLEATSAAECSSVEHFLSRAAELSLPHLAGKGKSTRTYKRCMSPSSSSSSSSLSSPPPPPPTKAPSRRLWRRH
ncbi:hypothetical protein V9T40_011095 [Parthenolecanium corni]|uniref:Uncharacterized protein n=1 Tax=Parthenolecanium corni TaxID=536013 RepID=A0AAN9T692_9HEMI